MIIKSNRCYSYGGNCPCLECDKFCCQMSWKIDTEKLCDKAREHCERCVLEKQSEVTDNENI